MKKIFILFFTLLSVITSAQIFNPVTWDFSQKQISDNEIELQFKATIEHPWHMYSQFVNPEGPIPTSFIFFYGEDTLISRLTEPVASKEFDESSDLMLLYFSDNVIFTQTIEINSVEPIELTGYVDFMVCDNGQCLPPDYVEFSFYLNGVNTIDPDRNALIFSQYQLENTKNTSDKKEGKSMWALFFIAFLSGFAALLTPCVFPMIPMTVSFFTKQSKTKAQGIANAIIYGLSIIVIYVALGWGVSYIFGADAMNNMATNVYFNVGFLFC